MCQGRLAFLTSPLQLLVFFFLKDPATTEISPLPLPAALPISAGTRRRSSVDTSRRGAPGSPSSRAARDAAAAPPARRGRAASCPCDRASRAALELGEPEIGRAHV